MPTMPTMLDTLRKQLSIPQIPVRALSSAGVIGSFVWLLANDLVHPVAVYLLELYLTF